MVADLDRKARGGFDAAIGRKAVTERRLALALSVPRSLAMSFADQRAALFDETALEQLA